jgi:hypothetical protein
VTTAEVTTSVVGLANRDQVSAYLARDDVRDAMQVQGVSPQAAAARVNAMSDV